jgi:microcystin-dependent protein
MAEEIASNLTGKRVSTTFRGLLHFPKSIEPSLAKQVVHDGAGTPTALTLGGDTMGMDVAGNVSCTGSLSVGMDATFAENIILKDGGKINDVSVLSSGSSVSLRAPSAAEVGKLRIRETFSDYELIFGNPTVTDKNLFSIIVKNDTSSNFYIKNSYSDLDINSPLWINRATGEVNIKSLRVTNIKTDPPPGTNPPPGQQATYGDPNRNVLPVGMICMFPVMGIPNGWIACDGKLHDKRSLPELFNVIGYNYSVLKSGNEFQVPDYRGLFVRGVDYKRGDEPTHTFLDPSGARNLDGTVQNDTSKSHWHGFGNGANNDDIITNVRNWNLDPNNGATGSHGTFGESNDGSPNSGGIITSGSLGTTDPIDSVGGETRPKNVVALYCIKW